MALTFITGDFATDAKITTYNRMDANDEPRLKRMRLLDDIGSLLENIAGQRGLDMRAEWLQERQRVYAQAKPRAVVQALPLLAQAPLQAQPVLRPMPSLPIKPQPSRAPITAPTKGAYNLFVSQFKKGADLIYGRSGPDFRDKYVIAVSPDCWSKVKTDHKNMRMQPDGDMDFVIIDTYNNAFLGTEIFATAAVVTQDGWGQTKADRRKGITPIHNFQETDTKSKTYLGQLENEHGEVGSFRDFLEHGTSYDINGVGGPDGLQMRYGRACKAGLAYGILKRKGKVHFALDGLTSASILDDVGLGKDKRKITGKELRWIFRHRDEPKIKADVIFWLDGAKTEPLWEKDRGLWEAYDKQVSARGSKGVKAFGQ